MRKVDGRLDKKRIVCVLMGVLNEAPVDLKFGQWKLFEISQCRLACAKIIHRDYDAKIAKVLKRGDSGARIIDCC